MSLPPNLLDARGEGQDLDQNRKQVVPSHLQPALRSVLRNDELLKVLSADPNTARHAEARAKEILAGLALEGRRVHDQALWERLNERDADIVQLQSEVGNLRQELAAAQSGKLEAEKQVVDLDRRTAGLNKQKSDLVAEVQALRNQLEDACEHARKWERTAAAEESRVNVSDKRVESLERELENVQQLHKSLEEQKTDQVRSLERDIESLRSEFAKERLEWARRESELLAVSAESRQTLTSVTAELRAERSGSTDLRSQISDLEHAHLQLKKSHQKVLSDLQEAETLLEECEKGRQDVQEKYLALGEKFEELRSQEESCRKLALEESEIARKALDDLQRDVECRSTRCAELQTALDHQRELYEKEQIEKRRLQDKFEKKVDTLVRQSEILKHELEAKNNEVQRTQEHLDELTRMHNAELDSMEKQISALKSCVKTLETEINGERARLDCARATGRREAEEELQLCLKERELEYEKRIQDLEFKISRRESGGSLDSEDGITKELTLRLSKAFSESISMEEHKRILNLKIAELRNDLQGDYNNRVEKVTVEHREDAWKRDTEVRKLREHHENEWNKLVMEKRTLTRDKAFLENRIKEGEAALKQLQADLDRFRGSTQQALDKERAFVVEARAERDSARELVSEMQKELQAALYSLQDMEKKTAVLESDLQAKDQELCQFKQGCDKRRECIELELKRNNAAELAYELEEKNRLLQLAERKVDDLKRHKHQMTLDLETYRAKKKEAICRAKWAEEELRSLKGEFSRCRDEAHTNLTMCESYARRLVSTAAVARCLAGQLKSLRRDLKCVKEDADSQMNQMMNECATLIEATMNRIQEHVLGYPPALGTLCTRDIGLWAQEMGGTRPSSPSRHPYCTDFSQMKIKLEEVCGTLENLRAENDRLRDDRKFLKRDGEGWQEGMRRVVTVIAQEVPLDDELVSEILRPETNKELFEGLQEALHSYIQHCEHEASFPLKSELLKLRSNLEKSEATRKALREELTEGIKAAKDESRREIEQATVEAFAPFQESMATLKTQVDDLSKQHAKEINEVNAAAEKRLKNAEESAAEAQSKKMIPQLSKRLAPSGRLSAPVQPRASAPGGTKMGSFKALGIQ